MIIGLVAKARGGKDQFGEYLIECFRERHQAVFTHIAFATQLKMMCKMHFGLSDYQLWGDEKEIPDERFDKDECTYWTAREIMQELGSFYRRIKNDYWVEALDNEIKKHTYDNVIITDTRHINECEYIKKNNGLLIRITRNEVGQIHGMDHESETALDDYTGFDIEIDNSGTLEDLYRAAEDTTNTILILERMMKKGETYNGT